MTELAHIEQQAYEYSEHLGKVSPVVFMRKFHLTFDAAKRIAHRVRIRKRQEAKKLIEKAQEEYEKRWNIVL